VTRLVAWVAGLVAGVVWLASLSIDDSRPGAPVFAGVRAVALLLGIYLLCVVAAGAGARLLGVSRLIRSVDVLTVPFVRRLLNGAVGLSLAAGSLAAPAGASEAPSSPPPVMRVIDAPGPLPPPTTPPGAVAAPSPPSPPTHEWVVRPGECFWSVAEARLEGADAADVARYWLRLIEANADRLRVPGDPGLIFPGQTLVLPPVD
jgi:hypothetical protein